MGFPKYLDNMLNNSEQNWNNTMSPIFMKTDPWIKIPDRLPCMGFPKYLDNMLNSERNWNNKLSQIFIKTDPCIKIPDQLSCIIMDFPKNIENMLNQTEITTRVKSWWKQILG